MQNWTSIYEKNYENSRFGNGLDEQKFSSDNIENENLQSDTFYLIQKKLSHCEKKAEKRVKSWDFLCAFILLWKWLA